MTRHRWTPADTRRLRTLAAKGHTAPEIAAAIGCDPKLVRVRARREGLTLKRAIADKFPWTPELDAELLRRYETEAAVDIARDFGCTQSALYQRAYKLGAKKTSDWARECTRKRWAQGRYENSRAGLAKGRGWNKGLPQSEWIRNPEAVQATQFRPGAMPYNWVPVGSYRVTTTGDVERKVADDRTPGMSRRNWKPVRVLVWEAAHGPVPPGHVVRFKDGRKRLDPDEITVDLLECITRAENMRRNSYHTHLPPDVARLVQLRGALNRKINNRLRKQANEREGRS
ncbi:HNH endonuclease signature motif containing protein [Caldimonas thermodepolymerans]|mgnify:CR=1 FL=1|uniref:HNH endonuclease signature motif containing protein n=1 Tax=Caldimonas thermodepolymerans TaxID=215580 RepID=UPI0024923EF4|nr:HNH endonuclease signature motif containing protein [Caldimonas thermodepolymerans]